MKSVKVTLLYISALFFFVEGEVEEASKEEADRSSTELKANTSIFQHSHNEDDSSAPELHDISNQNEDSAIDDTQESAPKTAAGEMGLGMAVAKLDERQFYEYHKSKLTSKCLNVINECSRNLFCEI